MMYYEPSEFTHSFALEMLILDDLRLTTLSADQYRDLHETLQDRYNLRSTLVTNQLPINRLRDIIGDPSLADANRDRRDRNAYLGQIDTQENAKLTPPAESE